ncbi:MAG: serine/threonine-protein kinase [Deltaproteobacteria bacterium]|nr:serine/threonine-protein kinase [Deltaproteobacteria bacterium]
MGLTRELDDPLVGSVVAGRYRILKRLAAGGMGVVYEATQEPLGRRVALKVIRGDATHDPVAQLRFEREAKTASSIQDPHVVVVYDFGALHNDQHGRSGGLHGDAEASGRGSGPLRADPAVSGLFLAMEFVEGETLRALLGQGRLTWRKSLVVVEHIARALSAAHGKGLVHRDLKPENVMLTTSTSGGSGAGGIEIHCKVLDFGLAKGIDEGLFKKTGEGQRLTGSGGFVGTPGYISPEHIDGAGEDPRQDVYALGIVWWEMLSARHPFPAETPMKTLLRQMHEEPPPLDDVLRVADSIPPAGAQLIRDMMAKSPRDRPKDGAAVLDRLRDLSQSMSTRFEVDSNAPTIAGRRSDIVSSTPGGHIDDIPGARSDVAAEVATIDHRLRAPTSPTPPPAVSEPAQTIVNPLPLPPVTVPTLEPSQRRRRPRRRLLGWFAACSVAGTVGGVGLMRVLEPPHEEPKEPKPVVVVDAGAPVTDVIVEGLASFTAMRAVREGLPEHALRVYRPGRTELSFDGDVASRLADQLQGRIIDGGGGHFMILEVKELDRGRVVVGAAPWVDAGSPVVVDAGSPLLGFGLGDAGVADVLDAGTLLVAPDGLEP